MNTLRNAPPTQALATLALLAAFAFQAAHMFIPGGVPTWSLPLSTAGALACGIWLLCPRRRAQRAKQSGPALEDVARRFAPVLDSLSRYAALWIADADSGRVLYVSTGYEALWQRSPATLQLEGHSHLDCVHPEDRARVHAGAPGTRDYRICLEDGAQKHIHEEIHEVEEGGARYRVHLAFDVTDYMARERQLHHALEHLTKTNIRLLRASRKDPLTGASNRQYMDDALQQAFREFRRYRTPMSLVFIDLTKFKQVNDERGHAVGDSLLRAVAEHLQASVRESDMVARYGGDEFVVLLRHADQAAAWKVVEKLNRRPVEVRIDGEPPVVGRFNAGVAQLSERHGSVAAWVEEVDRRMYANKKWQEACGPDTGLERGA